MVEDDNPAFDAEIRRARELGYDLSVKEMDDVEQPRFVAWVTRPSGGLSRPVALGQTRLAAAESAVRVVEAGEPFPVVTP